MAAVLILAGHNAYAYDDGDFQIWHTEIQEVKTGKDTKLTLEEEFRWADNANDFYYHHYDASLSLQLSKNLSLGIGYRQIYEKKSGKFKEENQPNWLATIYWDLWGCEFEDRSRLEYRHFDYQTDLWRYRNKLTLKLPLKFSKLEIQPYVSDETFFEFQGSTFTRNRFFAGLSMNIKKNIKAESYYLLQNSKSQHKWPKINVFGIKIKLSF
ncbi:MAG: DUF2490 domain-containing protein [Candidatus Omnitrophica bacterium]|nr:DUF2490 domain-containing protein [Candidatus Omnitrophota bacterium]MDD5354983.1 DUF2490 domain-containing protein [Candidatus Omnitrophota bacterium]